MYLRTCIATLGNYKILERVGAGKTAGVYRALNPSGRVVALKVLPPSKANERESLARFRREIALALQLDHPNLVRVLDWGQQGDVLFFVMEYLDGQTLHALLERRGWLPAKEAARIGFLALRGLQHLFEKGMVHRDIRPDNLMLCPAPGSEGNTLRSMVKILDLGLGRKVFDANSRAITENLTADDSLLGATDYLAPEQARDPSRVDIRADLYSLGCTLYHALAGQPPFKDSNVVRQILRHATQEPRRLTDLNRAVPQALEAIVLKLLAKDPADRFPTPASAAADLKQFLAMDSGAPPSSHGVQAEKTRDNG